MNNNGHPQTLQELVAKLKEIFPWCDVVIGNPENEGCITIHTTLETERDGETLVNNWESLGRGCKINR